MSSAGRLRPRCTWRWTRVLRLCVRRMPQQVTCAGYRVPSTCWRTHPKDAGQAIAHVVLSKSDQALRAQDVLTGLGCRIACAKIALAGNSQGWVRAKPGSETRGRSSCAGAGRFQRHECTNFRLDGLLPQTSMCSMSTPAVLLPWGAPKVQ